MSIDHTERIKGVVKSALKEAAMGEPFGFAVTGPGFYALPMPDGKLSTPIMAWFIIVTIRGAGLGEPDIGNGFPVPGVLPNDDDFREVARGLLERNRQERDATNAEALQAAGPSMKLSERPK